MSTVYLTLIILALLVLVVITALYSSLKNKKNNVKMSFNKIDITLKKRRQLIPNLVTVIKHYIANEKNLLEAITKLGKGFSNGTIKTDNRVYLENKLTEEIIKFNLSIEKNPELKANESVIELQEALNQVEEQLSNGRKKYNIHVLRLNNAIDLFPSSIVARFMKLEKKDFFEIPYGEKRKKQLNELF